MENLHKIARAYYNSGTETTKSEAQSLFRKMDTNGDGKVSLFEFKNYMKGDENRMKKYFDVVDIDGSGDLDFSEAVTFYYLLTVGRPECNNCNAVLLDTYFTCVTCSSNANNSFDLCTYCYNNNRNHQHKNFSKINSLVPGQGTGPVHQSNLQSLSNGLQMAGNIVTVGRAAVQIHNFLAEPSTSSSSQLPSQLPDVSPQLPSQLPDVTQDATLELADIVQDDALELADIAQFLVEAVCSLM